MMDDVLLPEMFPSFKKSVRARWAPVLLFPVSGSPECLVVGCAAANESEFHLEVANSLGRLDCLYAQDAESVRFAIEIGIKALERDLATRGLEALSTQSFGMSGVRVGYVRDGEGASIADIAVSWLKILSSLHRGVSDELEDSAASINLFDFSAEKAKRALKPPPLSLRLFDDVSRRNLQLGKYFNDDIQIGRIRRRGYGKNGRVIDFSGKRLTANFAELDIANLSVCIDNVKKRLWDLITDIDLSDVVEDYNKHEMILHKVPYLERGVSKTRINNMKFALNDLEEKADKKKIILRAFDHQDDITDHIVKVEAA